MKKLMTLVIALLLVVTPVCAERAVVSSFGEDSGEAELAAAVAETLGLPLMNEQDDSHGANRMLSDPERVLLGSQMVLIASLQGYADRDLRTDMKVIGRVAKSPLYLVMDAGTAADCGITDIGDLVRWLSENEYEMLCARHIDADPIDRAAVRLSEEMPVLTDIYYDDEVLDVLHGNEIQLAVLSEADLAAAEDPVLLILCCLDGERSAARPEIPCAAEAGLPVCQGLTLWLMASAEADTASVEAAARELPEEALREQLASWGYAFSPLFGEECEQEIRDTFADYKDYMTAEGLFFYEE